MLVQKIWTVAEDKLQMILRHQNVHFLCLQLQKDKKQLWGIYDKKKNIIDISLKNLIFAYIIFTVFFFF